MGGRRRKRRRGWVRGGGRGVDGWEEEEKAWEKGGGK
jgi:hypothetical protein